MLFSLFTTAGSRRRASGLLLVLLGLLSSCSKPQTLAALFQKTTPHDDYARAIDRAGLRDAALGKRWHAAADQALRDSLVVALPVLETGFFRADQPTAASYRYDVQTGEQVHIQLSMQPGPTLPAQVFIDAFALAPGQQPDLIKWTDTDTTTAGTMNLRYRVEASGQHLVRVQAELLTAGRYTLRVWREASFRNFPVRGRTDRDVGSVWGDPRDAGVRRHEGIDIFAPRGTPAVAAVSGIITRVDDTKIGGRVVWLLDANNGQHLYYAHLDRQLVHAGQRVQPGDTLGLVGNTGNARTTVPHLHFGIYRSGHGAVNPLPFVRHPDAVPPALSASAGQYLGDWVRLRHTGTTRVQQLGKPSVTLATTTPLLVLGQQRQQLRVELPDGRVGYISSNAVTKAQPLRRLTLAAEVEVQAHPSSVATALAAWPASTQVVLLGKAAGYSLLRGPAGLEGWARI